MNWQDFILMFGNVLLGYALVPQVIKGFKEKGKHIEIQTALITTIVLFAISFVYFTLGLFLSTIFCSISAILWAILLFQSLSYNK